MTETQAAEVDLDTARRFVVDAGLASPGEAGVWTPLTGGVSSQLWRLDLASGTVCVKGALSRLKVAAEWSAPVSRNSVEWRWLKFASENFPGAAPTPLAHDERLGLIAMEYLSESDYGTWKSRLLSGDVRTDDAAAVGDLIGRLHAVGADKPEVTGQFVTDDNFAALRIEPYFYSTARRHPDLFERIDEIARRTAHTHRVVVHGDVSPKNILCGPSGPVLLDAECAWFGDPAFDLAFVLTHLLLKCVVRPAEHAALATAAEALSASYLRHVDWESPGAVAGRAATSIPVLLLARVDGDSPVEYLNANERQRVRAEARSWLQAPTTNLHTLTRSASSNLAHG